MLKCILLWSFDNAAENEVTEREPIQAASKWRIDIEHKSSSSWVWILIHKWKLSLRRHCWGNSLCFNPMHTFLGCFPSSSAKCLKAHTKSLTFANLFPCRFFIIYPKYFNSVLRPVNWKTEDDLYLLHVCQIAEIEMFWLCIGFEKLCSFHQTIYANNLIHIYYTFYLSSPLNV